MKKSLVALVLALPTLLLASCGGEGSSSSEDVSSSGEVSSSSSEASSSLGEESPSSSSTSSEPASQVVVTGWERNAAYTTYLSRKDQASSELGESDFLSDRGLFRIGTANEVSLAPTVTVFDILSGSPSTLVGIPEGASVLLFDKEGASLKLEDYFDEAALSRLTSEGKVAFRTDLDPSLPRDVVLVYRSGGLLSDLSHEIRIVDGAYNVTSAKELVLFDNTHDEESYLEIKRQYFGDAATVESSYDELVVYSDIVIEKEDLPSWLLWSEADAKADPAVYGTLKDWQYLYGHEPTVEAGEQTFAIYGNYNQISLGKSFPYVVSEASATGSPTLPDADTGAISTHATLFGNNTGMNDGLSFETKFVDLAVYGNQGVSDDQIEDWKLTPEDPSDDTLAGGVLFAKNAGIMTFDNCRIQHFFTILVNNGPSSVKELKARVGHRPEAYVVNSRMSDCFSSMLFNYSDSLINVEGSIVEKAGGFLFINQAIPTEADPAVSSKWGNLEDSGASAYLTGSDIVVDEATRLENYVTGQGGWFSLYGIGTLFQSVMKPMVSDPLHPLGKTLFSKVDGAERINAVALSMNCDMESAGALQPGMDARVEIAGKAYTDYASGKEAFESGLAAIDPGNPMSAASLLPVLAGTPYGAGFLTSYLTASMMTYCEAGDASYAPYFFAPFSLDNVNYRTADITSLLTALFMGGDITAVEEADETKLASDYLSLAYVYGGSPTLPGGIEDTLADALAYEGSTAYQVIFGLNDYQAS